jgi:hypothetical protein
MTIEPKLHFKLQSKTTQGIKRRVGSLKFSLYDANAVIPVEFVAVNLRGKISDSMGSIELSRELFLQRG